jgi:hypothetical protein
MNPRPKHLPLRVLAGLLLCLSGGLLLARGGSVYRWVGADGQAHYGDRGPANAVKVATQSDGVDPGSLANLEIVRDGNASDVFVRNDLAGPLEVQVGLTESVNVYPNPELPLTRLIPGGQRVLVSRIEPGAGDAARYSLSMSAIPGDPHSIPEDVVYSMPVPEASGWQLGQGFHGGFSHSDEQNRFAVDLVVPVGTPVLAARGGLVMQVESGFDAAGVNRQRYATRANLVRILHDDGSMAVYAHLKENGVYVQVGDRVGIGQQIALSGNTGYSTGPHLHFCLQVNRGMRLVSIPFRMVGDSGFLPLPK